MIKYGVYDGQKYPGRDWKKIGEVNLCVFDVYCLMGFIFYFLEKGRCQNPSVFFEIHLSIQVLIDCFMLTVVDGN